MKKGKGVFFILSLVLISFMIFGSLNFLSAYTYCGCNQQCEYGASATPCPYGQVNCDRYESCETPYGGGWWLNGDISQGCGYGSSVCPGVKPSQYCGDGTCQSSSETCSTCSADCGSCCTQSCKTASSVACGGSLDSGNGCSTGCSSTGGTYCASGTCISGACKYVGSTYWTNLANSNKITNSQFGDTVRMVAAGSGFTVGQEINYTVYKDSTSWFFFHKTTALSSDLSTDLWKVNETGDAIYFKSKTGALENTSTTLNVGSTINSQPVASILSPEDNFKWSVNYSLSFMQNSSDEDDLLNVSWNFGDGNITSYNDYALVLTSTSANTQHTYSSGGIYNVKLTVSEMNRSNFDTDTRQVYIFQPGINVMPVIGSPDEDLVYTNWVTFNASQSFVANCSRGARSNVNFTAGDLNCSYVSAPRVKTTGNYNITVTWNVKEQNGSNSIGFPISGSWEQNYTKVVEFSRYFATAAKRSAYLMLDYS